MEEKEMLDAVELKDTLERSVKACVEMVKGGFDSRGADKGVKRERLDFATGMVSFAHMSGIVSDEDQDRLFDLLMNAYYGD